MTNNTGLTDKYLKIHVYLSIVVFFNTKLYFTVYCTLNNRSYKYVCTSNDSKLNLGEDCLELFLGLQLPLVVIGIVAHPVRCNG